MSWLLVVVMGLIVARSFQLQIVQGRHWQVEAEENRVAVLPLPAPRGIIYDSRGEQLLDNVASTDLVLDPVLLPSKENEAPLFDLLPGAAGITSKQLRGALTAARDHQRVTMLAPALEHDQVITVKSILNQLPGGVMLRSSSVRNYLYPKPLSHLLGYTGLASEEEVASRSELLLNDFTGKSGIEKQYDAKLRGRHGASYTEVDASGQPRRKVKVDPPQAGDDLHLTVDGELQRFIYQLLVELDKNSGRPRADKPLAAAVVALEPGSGKVRALVSYPAFDANVFSQPPQRASANSYLRQETSPLFNRAVSGTYPPGSIIKPLLAAAGLQEGAISPQTTFLSTGGIKRGQWFFPDWKTGGHGPTDVKKAIAESVNTFFYLLTGGDETRAGMGADKTVDWLKQFSWGEKTGIDLPGEATGLIPVPPWKEKNKGERWYIGDTYHLAIGQGYVLVTPLQVATATAAITNGGVVFEPRLLQDQSQPHGQRLPIQAQHLAMVREGMRAAVLEGSARSLKNLPIDLAGKTGTAQTGNEAETHAWFTSFGPYQQPELVITVLLEKGGEGDSHAVPVAEEIWRWWADNRH